MENSKIQGIHYNEPEGSWVYCILDPIINGEEYVNKLNENVEKYNEAVELYWEKEKELRELHKYYASFNEITGSDRLNEREPKYPPKTPLGFKNVQEACPEITAERERRREINKINDVIYQNYNNDVTEKINLGIKPFKDELLEKWPYFKPWINGYSTDKIYYKFYLNEEDYISEELK